MLQFFLKKKFNFHIKNPYSQLIIHYYKYNFKTIIIKHNNLILYDNLKLNVSIKNYYNFNIFKLDSKQTSI